jgi:bacterioferritin
MKTGKQLSSVQELRRRAREHLERGAVTPGYDGDVEAAVRILNEALATELVCTLRYRSHYYMANGIESESIQDEFLEHANEEQEHAHLISERIIQLNGVPDWNPATITTRSHAEFSADGSLVEMLQADLLAERIAIESYREMVQYFGNQDPTSRRLMETILAKEEEHAEELQTLLATLDPRKRSA